MQEPLNPKDFEDAMTDAQLRGVQILAGAMAFAPIVYLGLGYFISRSAAVPAQAPGGVFVECLFALAVFFLFGAPWVADWSLKRRDMAKALEKGIPMPKGRGYIQGRSNIVAYLLRAHCVLRMAMTDAAAVLGLALSFIAGGLLRQEPLWLLVLAPCPLATAFIVLTFPTRERLKVVFERTLQGRP